MKRIFVLMTCLVAIAALTAVLPASAGGQDEGAKKKKSETFSALAYLPSGVGISRAGSGSTANVTININGYSTQAEIDSVKSALLSGGQDAAIKAMGKLKGKGRVSLVGHVGFFDLKLVAERPSETGRIVIGVTDRPIRFLEAYYSGRSMDYKLGILEISLKKDEKGREEGEGVLVYAGKVKVEGNKVEIENYSAEPVKMMGVRRL
jgi:hypothetical protein